ncbi:bifunctional pyr operon transcriptional regulator/uracil phosphoribosyltransferase PyrR [Marinomonas sp. M1K-6]|uniref:Bifunctional pyr operon transcriptional regulator/uracil phosphoribosyltransferase PyrR n=1 Tax=Marinomonas profundi TaxID=2726122 RepID=A0A847R4G4_9GAMM|nr:bifunctional pyr operon transcriptional regulator/uracil phosphoribosyltransferase PyrR [Marinomonas profundi]NLQ17363.1 bifunctional pyr operon transcriptional regulator/uracil phosphoribosyltransferase PyrR [Marinomonas profundi]UDV01890.1 bifunctional pyr operon transcriptional regulator/uracil phosphoribosyltransferase PyrR [Marinomonas profundi]
MKLDLEGPLASMKEQLSAYCEKKNIEDAIVVGIHTGGVWVAEQLMSVVPTNEALATLDITFYRDDFTMAGLNPKVNQTSLPAIEDRHVILVDDVLMSGRTIRAAMNEIFDFGRPASITLAILYDLGQHELPIAADIVGQRLTLNPDQRVKLVGPDPLSVSIMDTH